MARTKQVRIAGATVGATAVQYTSGDLIGTKLTIASPLTTDSVATDGNGYLMSVVIEDLTKQNAAVDVVIFDSDPSGTTFTDNAALDIADADLAKILGCVSIAGTDYVSIADNSIATKTVINLPVFPTSGTLYACIISRGTPTYTANELSIKFGFEQN